MTYSRPAMTDVVIVPFAPAVTVEYFGEPSTLVNIGRSSVRLDESSS